MKDFDFLIFIGRFQPFHMGHAYIVNRALSKANKVIMLLGSSNKVRSLKNPFTFYERSEMIKESLHMNVDNLLFRPLDDFNTDEEWIEEVKKQVSIAIETCGCDPEKINVGLIGMNKDETTYYLKHFSFWPYVEIERPDDVISATEVREWLFGDNVIDVNNYLMCGSYKFLKDFKKTETYKMLKDLKQQ